ncbi:hypothetical protein EEL52_04995 [Muribaculaceae bacterium Isolate-113 (HZI)]|nr:hypothetical protein EEL53_06180 [Muribaculaceae bacterium Isolate-114 (HZI)]ROT23489.1 hypothetical protein EEL52_04995 [Muribaculaceae bacterium Isolate-113 (HZI)]
MQSSYVKGFVGFDFIFGYGNSAVLHTIFDKFIKVLQSYYKSAQFAVFIIGACFLAPSITENKDAVRESQTI